MATTISNVTEAMVDERVIPALKRVLPLLSLFSYVIENEEREVNQTVKVPLATDPTVGDKTAGTFSTDSGTVNSVTVTYDRFRSAAFALTEGSVPSRLAGGIWMDKMEGAVYGVAKDAIDYVLSLITLASYGDVEGTDKKTVAPADFGQSDIGDIWAVADSKIKSQNKVLMLGRLYTAAIFGSNNIMLLNATGGGNTFTTGTLPAMLGMQTAVYGDFPANSQSLGGAVIGRAALALGIARPTQLLSSGDGDVMERRFITEPDSGLTVQLTTKAGAGGTIAGEVALLYGAIKAQNSIVRVCTA